MRCTKCLAPLTVCACFAVGSLVTDDVTPCRGIPNVGWSWCEMRPMGMPHDEPAQMPGAPLPNLTVTVSTSGTSVHSGIFRWPSSTST